MRKNLEYYVRYQVFLNYPFDGEFASLEDALQFPVVAGNLLPLCAKDLSTPDRPRLDMLVDAIANCHYSIHELSRSRGEGDDNFARMNMPIETGMAMFHALHTQRRDHRCAFFVPTLHDYQRFASDLAGLDPRCHNNDEDLLVRLVYEWLHAVVPVTIFNLRPTKSVVDRYHVYKDRLPNVNGSGNDGTASFEERRELMYQVCQEMRWWDWRAATFGREEFPVTPILWKEQIPGATQQELEDLVSKAIAPERAVGSGHPLVNENINTLGELSGAAKALLSEILNDDRSDTKGVSFMFLSETQGSYVPYLWDNDVHGALRIPKIDIATQRMAADELARKGVLNQFPRSDQLQQYALSPEFLPNA